MTRIVVLIKDFDSAKQRLSSALGPQARRALAAEWAEGTLLAVGPGALVVAGSETAAAVAREHGNEVVVEASPGGQNQAARLGIGEAVARGADSVLLLSSDLPLIDAETIDRLLDWAGSLPRPVVVAVPAVGRGGTNALYLAPPRSIGLHFGDVSLAKFEADARSRGVRFELYHSPELALDVDEPSDLASYRERQRAG